MKKYLVQTESESGDSYSYFFSTKKELTSSVVNKWLKDHGSDRDEEQSYEHVESIIEIKEENFINI